MRALYGQHEAVADWVAAHIPKMAEPMRSAPYGLAFGPSKAIGVVNEAGELVGGVVFHNWQPTFRSIELSFAASSRRWLTQTIVGELLRYPFDQLDCQRVTGFTPRKATSARRFLDRFGFKREGLVRRGFGDDDAIISGLLRKEWQRSKWARPLPERLTERARRVQDQQAIGPDPA